MSEKKQPHDVEDTGHEWDGIRELKNDPPRWWLIGYFLSPVFIVVYLILYPSIPLIHDYTRGLLGWTQIDEYNESMAQLKIIRAPFEKKIEALSAQEILSDSEMKRYAELSSKVTFGDHCGACHGSGGQGKPGFPILADDDWLYGGTLETIIETITDGREGEMPAFGDQLSEREISDLVAFVIASSKGERSPAGHDVFMGKTSGEANCVDCHGEEAKGDHDMGSANLTDRIWRFGGSEEAIRRTITYGVNQDGKMTRRAIMPTFGEKLKEADIKKLAVKVWSFGGGEKPQEEE